MLQLIVRPFSYWRFGLMPFSQGHKPVQVQILRNLSDFSVHASRSSLTWVSDVFFVFFLVVVFLPTEMWAVSPQGWSPQENRQWRYTHHTHLFRASGAFVFFYGVHATSKFKRREHTERVMLVLVVCVASIHHPCQSVFYDCVHVYEGADQDAYSAWPVRSLLVGFIGRSGWWRL